MSILNQTSFNVVQTGYDYPTCFVTLPNDEFEHGIAYGTEFKYNNHEFIVIEFDAQCWYILDGSFKQDTSNLMMIQAALCWIDKWTKQVMEVNGMIGDNQVLFADIFSPLLDLEVKELDKI